MREGPEAGEPEMGPAGVFLSLSGDQSIQP